MGRGNPPRKAGPIAKPKTSAELVEEKTQLLQKEELARPLPERKSSGYAAAASEDTVSSQDDNNKGAEKATLERKFEERVHELQKLYSITDDDRELIDSIAVRSAEDRRDLATKAGSSADEARVAKYLVAHAKEEGRSNAAIDALNTRVLSWAACTEEDEAKVKAAEAAINQQKSLLEKIQKLGLASKTNEVFVPKNLDRQFPLLYEKLKNMARMTGMVLVEDPGNEVSMAHAGFFSGNTAEEEKVLKAIQGSKNADEVLTQLANISAIIDCLDFVPNKDTMNYRGTGKSGIGYILFLAVQSYGEFRYNTQFAQQGNWWKNALDVKQNVKASFAAICGTQKTADVILTALDILYRRMIRVTLQRDSTTPVVIEFNKLMTDLSQNMSSTGYILYMKLLKTKVVKVKKQVTITNQKGKETKEWRDVSKQEVIKPRLPIEPLTVWEGAVASKINKVLDEVERDLDKMFEPRNFSSPKYREEKMSQFVKNLYESVKPFWTIAARRRTQVRLAVQAYRPQTVVAAGPRQQAAPTPWKPSQGEWMAEEMAFLANNQQTLEAEYNDAVSLLIPLAGRNAADIPESDWLQSVLDLIPV